MQFSELNLIIEKYKAINQEKFSLKTILFEHGSVNGDRKGGNSVVHAHLHLFPSNFSFIEDINYDMESINTMSDLSDICKSDTTYLFYSEDLEKHFVITNQNIESQFFRKILSKQVNLEEYWNWREYPFIDKMKKTLKVYKK